MLPAAYRSLVRLILVIVVGVELAVIGGGYWMLGDAGYPWITPLEARPLGRSANVRVTASDLVDVVNVFCGDPVLGRDPQAEEGVSPATFRAQLAFDPGHFSWLALSDKAGAADPLRRMALSGLFRWSDEWRQAAAGLSDGLISVFYDLGGDERTWLHNWSTVGVQEMQMSSLLPWMKRLDVIVLSSYDPEHCGGLAYVMRTTPDVLLLGPPLPKTASPRWGEAGQEILRTARAAHRLRVLPIGLHRLTSRLSVLVYPVPAGPAEAALVIRTGKRMTVLAGAGGRPLQDLVALVEKEAGAPVTGFVGAVGLEGDEAAARNGLASLRGASRRVRVAAGHGTSPEGLSLLSEVLGADAVKAARLGARIPLNDF